MKVVPGAATYVVIRQRIKLVVRGWGIRRGDLLAGRYHREGDEESRIYPLFYVTAAEPVEEEVTQKFSPYLPGRG